MIQPQRGAAVARRVHTPKVGGSIPPVASLSMVPARGLHSRSEVSTGRARGCRPFSLSPRWQAGAALLLMSAVPRFIRMGLLRHLADRPHGAGIFLDVAFND